MPNWIVQDMQTSQSWDLSVNGGQFYLSLNVANNPTMRNPIVQDSLLLGTYYQIGVINGEITYTPIKATQADNVYMYDSYLKQWWVIIITEGMFGINTSTSPSGGNGFYPLEYYYRWLKGGKNVKYLIKVVGKKDYSIKVNSLVKGMKTIDVDSRIKVGAKKLFPKQDKVHIRGTKLLDTTCNASIKGYKVQNIGTTALIRGVKSIDVNESIRVKAKKDLSPILMALDII